MTDRSSILTSQLEATTRKPLKIYRWRTRKHHEDKAPKWKHLLTDPNEGNWGGRHTRPPSRLRIITWNLDYETHDQPLRILKALENLQFIVFECGESSPGPVCIMFQEITPSGLQAICEHSWVRDHFSVAPISADKWPGPHRGYGNVTLLERTVPTFAAHIVVYGTSQQERTAIELDVRMLGYQLRLLNTHLESMAQPTNKFNRHRQLAECASFLKRTINGGLIAGDLNAIDSDWDALVKENRLMDAGEKCGEIGHTWGDQRGPSSGDYPAARLDRILYQSPHKLFSVVNVRRIGIGLRHEALWVSDHFGLMAEVVNK